MGHIHRNAFSDGVAYFDRIGTHFLCLLRLLRPSVMKGIIMVGKDTTTAIGTPALGHGQKNIR